MAETLTDRFGLVQWSSGSDSPGRLDFNSALLNLEQRAAIDPGITYSALPATFLTGGRYALVVPPGGESAYRTIYRRNDGGTWDFAGGNAVRAPFHFRANGQARTDAAVTLSHPDFAAAGGTLGYDGSALLTGTVRVYDADDAGRGAVLIGTSAAPNLTSLGRLYVRTRATGERGLVLQPYTPGEGDAGSGNLLTARTAGGSDTLTIDPLGRLRAIAAAAFGGAALPATSVLAIAPTSNPSDGITNGLLVHGQTGSEGAEAKTIMQVWRDAADTAPLLNIGRDGINIGRLPWSALTLGGMMLSANNVLLRASGKVDNTAYFHLRRSDPTSDATEANPTLDTQLLHAGPNGITAHLPLTVSQRLKQNVTTMVLHRVGDFTKPFLDLARLVPNGSGGEDSQLMASWGPDGRLRTGLPWRTTGTVRDSRQSVTHLCNKRFTPLFGAIFSGQLVNRLTNYEYTWPVMTVRSADAADLDITTIAEYMLTQAGSGLADAQSVIVETYVSINAGAYALVGTSENAPTASSNEHRAAGDSLYVSHRLANVAAGATFQLRTRFAVGSSNPNAWLRSFDLKVQETSFEIYTAA